MTDSKKAETSEDNVNSETMTAEDLSARIAIKNEMAEYTSRFLNYSTVRELKFQMKDLKLQVRKFENTVVRLEHEMDILRGELRSLEVSTSSRY